MTISIKVRASGGAEKVIAVDSPMVHQTTRVPFTVPAMVVGSMSFTVPAKVPAEVVTS